MAHNQLNDKNSFDWPNKKKEGYHSLLYDLRPKTDFAMIRLKREVGIRRSIFFSNPITRIVS